MTAIRRVMIIGGPGSGKSTLARAMGKTAGLPVVHLDAVFWQPGWREPDRERFNDTVRQIMAGDSWIMEGNYSATWPERARRADLVIFLDVPTGVRMARIVRRTILNLGREREDIGKGCPERLDWAFLKYAYDYRRERRARALALCASPDVRDKSIRSESIATVLDEIHIRKQQSERDD